MKSGKIFAEPRKRGVKYSQSHYSPRLKRIIVLVYTHEVISTKSERKPLKSTIWLTDQITRKFKNRSLQKFQTWQFTSLSFRKQQRNGLNGTAKSLNCFLTWEEKWSFVVFYWLARFIAKRACCVVVRMKRWQKWPARLLEVRRRLPVPFFFLFTWNVEFLQTFAFKFVVINKLRFFREISVRKTIWYLEFSEHLL